MLITTAPFIQNNLIYPDLTQANQVAQAINSSHLFSGQARTKLVRLPKESVPPQDPTSAFMVITNSPSVGLKVFYPDWSSCSSVINALKQGGAKAVDAHVRVTKKYVY